MERYFAIKNKLADLFSVSDKTADSAESLVLEGGNGGNNELYIAICIFKSLGELNLTDVARFFIDDDHITPNELTDFFDCGFKFGSWKLVFNKSLFSSHFAREFRDVGFVFFLLSSAYEKWLNSIDPLSSSNTLFFQYQALVIFSPDVPKSFGGPRIAVQPLRDIALSENLDLKDFLPEERLIREHVHLVPSEPIKLSPRTFSLSWGEVDSSAASRFRILSAISIAATLSDVIYGKGNVVLKGIRHLELPISSSEGRVPSYADLTNLQNACRWVYNERTDTRKKLLNDRISLEAEEEFSLLDLLYAHLETALKQSKDQYRFVILDRKDEYAKELRELLKDLREQADLYASKIRGLIFGLLRDILAAFVFVALSLSSRLSSNPDILFSDVGIIFFKALSFYFFSSVLLQVSASSRDVILADRELQKWAEVTRDYISRSELRERINNDLRERRVTFWVYIFVISFIYISLGIVIWNIQDLVSWLIAKP